MSLAFFSVFSLMFLSFESISLSIASSLLLRLSPRVLSKLDAMDNDMDSKLRNIKEKTEKNANDIAGHSNLLKEHNESINSNITSITSISNKLAASEKDLDTIKENVAQNHSDIDNLRATQNDLQTKSSDLEARVRSNLDHLKNVDDTLDGLHKSNERAGEEVGGPKQQ
jgi:chromosome segregation ATPase